MLNGIGLRATGRLFLGFKRSRRMFGPIKILKPRKVKGEGHGKQQTQIKEKEET